MGVEQQSGGSSGLQSWHRLPRGTTVGRYLVLDELGAGAMGAVYAAYDPELARQVALKVVHPRVVPSSGRQADRMRLMREAQAMARVSHPNVVAVFDVGIHHDAVYLAMELIRGSNLRRWSAMGRPTRRQLLDVFVAAGRGLQAAHAGGLVHRDFKPENVLVALEGQADTQRRGHLAKPTRVCVTDFGLARAAPTGDDAPAPRSSAGSSGMLGVTLTVEGDMIGTPVYMAPEQHEGEPADARSDQFAFCVALYEAVYGRRPFAGRDAKALRRAKLEGPPSCPARPPPGPDAAGVRGRVPRWLRDVLQRGLQPDPTRRFASMSTLLARLERAPVRRKTVVVGGMVAVLGFGTSWGLARVVEPNKNVCDDAAELPVLTWNDQARAAIGEAFEHAGRVQPVVDVLDEHVRRWTAVHRDVCEATWVRGEQSADLLDVRMSCLRTQWQDVAAIVRLLSTSDPEIVEHAMSAIGSLTVPEVCRKLAIDDTSSPPSEPQVREAVAQLRAALAETRALHRAGKHAEAAERIEPSVDEARGIGFGPVVAEALLLAAELYEDAGDLERANAAATEALSQARGAGDLRAEAEAWTRLAFVHGYDRNDATHGRFCGEMALAVVERLGGDAALAAWAHSALGTIAYVGAQDEAAVEHWGRALELRRTALGERHVLVAASLDNLGGALYRRGRFEDAERYLRRALELRADLLGPDHPVTAESHANLGLVLVSQHRADEALDHLERALEQLDPNEQGLAPLRREAQRMVERLEP